MRWTREVSGVGSLPYGARLRELDLFSISGRLLRLDLIKIWKVLNFGTGSELFSLFELARSTQTRGHSLKLSVPICNTEVLRRSLAVRRVFLWNSLPAEIVEADSLHLFKRGLDVSLADKLYAIL